MSDESLEDKDFYKPKINRIEDLIIFIIKVGSILLAVCVAMFIYAEFIGLPQKLRGGIDLKIRTISAKIDTIELDLNTLEKNFKQYVHSKDQ